MQIRQAYVDDVPVIRDLINSYAEFEIMLFRSLADLYGAVRDFVVCEDEGKVVGCCALAIIWADLAELRSLAVAEEHQGQGIGRKMVEAVLEEARRIRLKRVFTLTLEQQFFERMGFTPVEKDTLPMKVWSDCVRCPKQAQCDEVALIYDIAPNGNH